MSIDRLCPDCVASELGELQIAVDEVLNIFASQNEKDRERIIAKLKRVRSELRALQNTLEHSGLCNVMPRRRR